MGEVKQDRRCLLITGTVVPNSNFVAHTNVEERLEEYYEGLLFYANEFKKDDLYFLENSEYDFSENPEFQKLFNEKNITLMKFPVSDKFDQGKGYQEFEMLDSAIETLSDQYSSFIKITGRYKVINLSQIANTTSGELIIDCHKNAEVAQTNVFLGDISFYNQYLKNLYKKVNDGAGIYIEKIVYDKIFSEGLANRIMPFSSNPIIKGVSGSYGGSLDRNKWKMLLRNMERKFMRLFGIKQFLIEY